MGLSIGTGVRLDLIRDPGQRPGYIGRPTSATRRWRASGTHRFGAYGAGMRRSRAGGTPRSTEAFITRRARAQKFMRERLEVNSNAALASWLSSSTESSVEPGAGCRRRPDRDSAPAS